MSDQIPSKNTIPYITILLRELLVAFLVYAFLSYAPTYFFIFLNKIRIGEPLYVTDYLGQDSGFRLFLCITLYVFMIRFISSYEKRFIAHHSSEIFKAKLIRTVRYLTHFLMLLYVLNTLGYPLNQIIGLMAIGGVGSIAVTFAAQDVIKNLFGGLAVFLDRPFKTGDFVVFPKLGIEGRVVSISWRSTKIQTLSHTIKTIQNHAFLTDVVESMPGKKSFILDWNIYLSFSERTRITEIKKKLLRYLDNHNALGIKPSEIHVQSLSPKGIALQFVVHIKKHDFENIASIRDELLIGCSNILDELSVEWLS